MKEVFQFRELLYNLRFKMCTFLTQKISAVYHGLNTMIYLLVSARSCKMLLFIKKSKN